MRLLVSKPSAAIFARISAGLVLVSVAGCGNPSAPPPAVEVRTVTVKVPVPTACVDKASIPAEPPKVGSQLTGDARHDLDVVSASALRLRQALKEAFALLSGCVKP